MNIFLYRPENFQNVCAITRSLEAFGMNRCFVYDTNNIIRSHYGKSYRKKLRTVSAWAFEKIQFCLVSSPEVFLEEYTGRVLATVPVEHGASIVDFCFQKDDLFVFESESRGLPAEIIEHADMSVYIPQYGVTESLNVSHAVAICAYEYRRKNW